jgi:hypothetical protein
VAFSYSWKRIQQFLRELQAQRFKVVLDNLQKRLNALRKKYLSSADRFHRDVDSGGTRDAAQALSAVDCKTLRQPQW